MRKPYRHEINVKTMEEVKAQMKLLLENGYQLAIQKNDNLLGCVSYTIIYEKQAVMA